MPNVDEAIGQQGPLKSTLAAGVGEISSEQVITFTQYKRVVLPLDGYVFWVRTDLLSLGSLYNNFGGNFKSPLNSAPQIEVPAPILTVKGSLHYSTTNQQNEDESFSVNRVVFTSEDVINDLNDIDDGLLWIGVWDGLKFAFSSRSSFYRQSGLFHYVGDAVYPVMETQLIDSPNKFGGLSVIVSNSLPIWLALNAVVPVFPSFALPDNLRPPYAAIHIAPLATEALQAVPYLDRNSSHWQLARDKVKITLYGLRNNTALDYYDYIIAYMTNYSSMGLMNHPIIQDEKRTQTELNILAQKKVIEFEVSYYQNVVRDIGRQLILSCIPSFIVSDEPVFQ